MHRSEHNNEKVYCDLSQRVHKLLIYKLEEMYGEKPRDNFTG